MPHKDEQDSSPEDKGPLKIDWIDWAKRETDGIKDSGVPFVFHVMEDETGHHLSYADQQTREQEPVLIAKACMPTLGEQLKPVCSRTAEYEYVETAKQELPPCVRFWSVLPGDRKGDCTAATRIGCFKALLKPTGRHAAGIQYAAQALANRAHREVADSEVPWWQR